MMHNQVQPLRVSLVGVALCFVGACFALRGADERGYMLLWSYVALTLGLFIGERVVYRIYSKKIMER